MKYNPIKDEKLFKRKMDELKQRKDKINKLLDEYGYQREMEGAKAHELGFMSTKLDFLLCAFPEDSDLHMGKMSGLIELYKHLKLCIGNDMNIKSIVSTPYKEYKKNMEKKTKIDGAATKLILDSTYNAIIKYDQRYEHLWTVNLLKKDITKGIELTDDDLDAILEYEKEISKHILIKDTHKIGYALTIQYNLMLYGNGIFTPNKNGNPTEKDLAFLYDWCVIHGKLDFIDGGTYKEKYDKVKYLLDAYEKARMQYGVKDDIRGYYEANMARFMLNKHYSTEKNH